MWRSLAPGLAYTQITGFDYFPAGQVHAFRIDLEHYSLKSAQIPEDGSLSPYRFLRTMAAEHAVIASNGGFFTPALKSLGLRVTANQVSNPLRATAWWHVFFIQDQKAHLVKKEAYHPTLPVAFAIQAGPILVQDHIVRPKPSEKIEERTAIGITGKGEVILLATENLMLSVQALATLMQRPAQEGGLDCADALNLDGGHSTQLYASLPGFSLQVMSATRVADAVLVVPIAQP